MLQGFPRPGLQNPLRRTVREFATTCEAGDGPSATRLTNLTGTLTSASSLLSASSPDRGACRDAAQRAGHDREREIRAGTRDHHRGDETRREGERSEATTARTAPVGVRGAFAGGLARHPTVTYRSASGHIPRANSDRPFIHRFIVGGTSSDRLDVDPGSTVACLRSSAPFCSPRSSCPDRSALRWLNPMRDPH